MTVALVHGNPETDVIWSALRAQLGRDDVVALSPPGFGAPAPESFGATSDDYLAWLVEAVAGLEGPVDLVGHDWGGGHVFRLACERPELIRSWATDIGGCFDPEYVWHEAAQGWQTPEVGERQVAAMVAAPVEARAQRYEALGLDPTSAHSMAAAVDDEMARCILALYRSAAQPAMAQWGGLAPQAAARPGLVIIPTEDPYTGGAALAQRTAARAGAAVASLEGRGHWWMCEDPAEGAAVLQAFLAGLD